MTQKAMSETIRTFIAIELNDQTRAELVKLQDKLKQSGADVKWAQPQNIHLTLKFLGNVEKDKIKKIKIALDMIAEQTKAFSISLSEMGAFPNVNSPRVVWVGIVGARHAVPLLASEIEERLSKLGFAKEDRPFSAHLTLGRIRSPKGREKLKEIIEGINKNSSVVHPLRGGFARPSGRLRSHPSSIVTNHITLFQSTLTPKGPIYTNLYEAKLKPI